MSKVSGHPRLQRLEAEGEALAQLLELLELE
jgi:hypothetical protein